MRLFVTGTDTGVGKTVVGGGLAMGFGLLGMRVGVLKPAESGCGEGLEPGDGAFLLRCAGSAQSLEEVVLYRYALPLAPAVAAVEEGRDPMDPAVVSSTLNRLEEQTDIVIVEGAGGLLVPMASRFTCGDLAKLLDSPLVVVARPNLGTINHTLLTVRVAQAMGLEVKAVMVNCYDPRRGGPEQKSNPQVMREMLNGVPVYTVPRFAGLEELEGNEMMDALKAYNWKKLASAVIGGGGVRS